MSSFPSPVIRSERLDLREYGASDAGLVHEVLADWEVRSVEIGYGVRGDERGKGYASEALSAVASWALIEGGVQRAWLTANTDNVASVRVAEKAGFRREGTLRRAGLERRRAA